MVLESRPDASFASTRLTRRNYAGPSLLSRVGGESTRINNEAHMDTDELVGPGTLGATGNVQNNRKKKAEPATDDEPISSSDESEQLTPVASLSPRADPLGRKTFEWSAKDLEKKLAEGDTAADELNTHGSDNKKKAEISP